MSRTKIKEVIKVGGVLVNGNTTQDPDQRLKMGDLIEIQEEIKPKKPSLTPDDSVKFDILYEDESLLVINKPAGVVVHAGAGNLDHTLVNGLLAHCSNLSEGSDEFRPGIVHRIDKDTSGILVVAKNDFVHMELAKQFAEHSIGRRYICFCYGIPRFASGTFDSFIARDRNNPLKMTITHAKGKRAITHYKVQQTFCNSFSKIECELETGRTHQIRAHMSNAGHPLIGDQIYMRRSNNSNVAQAVKDFPRQALHAYYLQFRHPITGNNMQFDSEMPADMLYLENLLKNLT